MPLVLHSSSCCDVCLDAYSDSDGSPHAIPCGHIFCRTCLVSVEPTNCPLCRKAFNRERIKKLHVDRPEADMEGDFLRRVALAFDAELEDQTRLTEELDAWLGGRSADDHVPLRKVLAAFKLHHRLVERTKHDQKRIKHTERQLAKHTDEFEQERDMFKATESSLHLRVSELSLQIEHLEAQVVPLRAELSKYQYSKNPLPPPPEPVPLDRFPAFARPTAESAEGYAAYFTPEQAPARSFNNSPRNGDLLDKGKGKGKQPVHQSGLYNPTPSASVIIPGATPSQRVIPSDDAGRHAYHTHAPASAYVNGYANGYDQGYGTANGDTNGYTPTNYASTSSYQLPPRRQEEVDNGLEDAMGSLRLWGMPTASAAAIAPVVGRPPDSAPATMPPRRPAYVAPPSSSHTADDTSVSSQTTSSHTRPTTFRRSTVQIDGHLNTRPPPIYAPAVPAPAADQSVRFNVPDADQPANDARARHAVQERNRINRQSYSSWGTVDSNAAPGSGSTRGSMSEFGSLMNFPLQAPPAQAQRNSLSSQDGALLDRGLVATPRQDSGQPLGFVQPTRPGHAHSYSVPSNTLPLVESEDSSYEVNSLQRSTRVNNRQRTVPRRFSQLPTGTPEFGINPMPTAPPPIENALGLELGAAASPEPHNPITAPTPRVQMAPYIRSWSNSLDLAR